MTVLLWMRRTVLRFLLWVAAAEEFQELLRVLRGVAPAPPSIAVPKPLPTFLPWDVAAETGEWRNIFKLSPSVTLTVAEAQAMTDLPT